MGPCRYADELEDGDQLQNHRRIKGEPPKSYGVVSLTSRRKFNIDYSQKGQVLHGAINATDKCYKLYMIIS